MNAAGRPTFTIDNESIQTTHVYHCRTLSIIIETIHNYIFRVLHDTIFYDIRNEALLRLDVFVEL